MTIDISDNNPRIIYTVAQGVTQTSFAVPFEFFADSDLNVYVDSVLKTITTHYTVSGGDGSTGTVTMSVTGATGGSIVAITRDVTIERVTDFTPGVEINRAALNTQLDTLTAIAADIKDQALRAIRVQDFDPSTTGFEIPLAATRANKVFAFNSSGGVSITNEIGTYKGNWAASTAFAERDIVKDTSNSNIYLCLVAHTSSGSQPISTNADVAKWALLVDAATAATASASAASSASAAAASASSASSSASSASASASSASTDATYVAGVADNYLGAKTTDPALDNQGDPLVAGQLYFNTVAGDMRVYNGSAWVIAYIPASGYVTLSGTETLTNKTLNDPKISLGGSNGTSGQALVSQGAGVAPAWGSVSSVITKTYTNRADLRSVDGPATLIAVVESLGVFAWESGSTQVDDDETCFATTSGRWLLYAAAWDLVYEYIVGELDILGEIRPIYDTVYNSNTSIGALSSIQITKLIDGVELTDAVIVTPVLPLQTGNDGSVTYTGAVTATNQVTVNIGNASASSRNLTVGNIKIIVVKGNP